MLPLFSVMGEHCKAHGFEHTLLAKKTEEVMVIHSDIEARHKEPHFLSDRGV